MGVVFPDFNVPAAGNDSDFHGTTSKEEITSESFLLLQRRLLPAVDGQLLVQVNAVDVAGFDDGGSIEEFAAVHVGDGFKVLLEFPGFSGPPSNILRLCR